MSVDYHKALDVPLEATAADSEVVLQAANRAFVVVLTPQAAKATALKLLAAAEDAENNSDSR